MIKKVFHIGVVASLVAAAGTSWAASSELRGVHLSATPGSAQITLDLTDSVTQKIFKLDHPDRAVIDLGHTRLARGLRAPAAGGIVSGVRIGTQPGGNVRVVIQLKAPVPAHSAWTLMPGRRGRQLVVTLGNSLVAGGVRAGAGVGVGVGAGSGSGTGTGAGSASGTVTGTAAGPGAGAEADASTNAAAGFAPRIIRAAHAPAESGRDVVIAVDAGHGGMDPGAIGRGGTREKDVVLAIARALAERINGEPGMRAVLTRDRDEFLVLRDRIGRARIAKADMFVSVHADSILNRSVSGASVYVLSEHGATNEAARWLADRENAADLMGGVKLDDKDKALASVLLDLSQTANISASMTAAQRVIGSLDAVGQVRKAQVQQAGFVVLKSPDIPSMLVETAYISNPEEELRLRNTRQQAALADAIFAGLRGYFTQNPPSGTRFAQARRSTVASAGVLAAPAASPH
jgi:N-acetylmuramoyl-L-alanine amidase